MSLSSPLTPQPGEPFVLGINYWPTRRAMWMWEQFDPAELRDELALIAGIGITHLRFFLLWESFQPRPDAVSSAALKKLVTFVDLARDAGLVVQPTLFTGHMSGPNWAPDWLLGKDPVQPGDKQVVSLTRRQGAKTRIYNTFTEPFVIDAERLLIREVVAALRGHPAVWGYSLGNEPDLFCRPPTADIGRRWMRDRVADIKAIEPGTRVLIGLHVASLDGDCGLRVDHAAAETDVSVMHGYSIFAKQIARSRMDPDYVPFACALTTALAGRPAMFEEFGTCTHDPDGPSRDISMTRWDGTIRTEYFAAEDEAAEYYEKVLAGLVTVGAVGAWAWCFPSYDRSLWDRPSCDLQIHERFFGLWRADYTLKPMGREVERFAASRPVVRVADPGARVVLGCTPDEYYREPMRHQRRLYEQFGTLGL